jgi:hypothetical protein
MEEEARAFGFVSSATTTAAAEAMAAAAAVDNNPWTDTDSDSQDDTPLADLLKPKKVCVCRS